MSARSRLAPLSIILVGSGPALRACAELVLSAGHRIVHVVGRSPDCRLWAAERNIACCDGLQNDLRLPPCDYLLSIANDRILAASELISVRHGAYNCHNSLLPAYRGAFAASWALLDNRPTHGASWHRITAQIDAGAVAAQRAFPIASDDTARSLNRKSLDLGIALLRDELLPAMGRRKVTERALPPSDYYPVRRRAPSVGQIPWQQGNRAALRHMRALDRGPIDNSFDLPKLVIGEVAWLVSHADPVSTNTLIPGTVCSQTDGSMLLGTADGTLRINGVRRPTPLPGGRSSNLGAGVRKPISGASARQTSVAGLDVLGAAAAASENRMVQRCQAISSDLSNWPSGTLPVPAANWDLIAETLMSAYPDDAERTFQLATPGLELRGQAAGCKAMFHQYLPFTMTRDERSTDLAERLRAHDDEVPALIDAADRRRILLQTKLKNASFVAIVSTSNDKWCISV